jgi:hypothetical protein
VRRPAKVDLSLELVDAEAGLVGKLEYPNARFERSAVEAFVRDLEHILRAASSRADVSIEELPARETILL